MSSLFSHIFIPLAVLFIFSEKFKLDPKKIVILSFFGILPDIDIFLFHRASFHNIFILIVPILIYILTRDKNFGIICFYLTSHLVLDIFNGGIFSLYPFYENVFYVRTEILFNQSNFIPLVEYGISDKIENMGKGEGAISSENVGIVLLLVIVSILSKIKYKKIVKYIV